MNCRDKNHSFADLYTKIPNISFTITNQTKYVKIYIKICFQIGTNMKEIYAENIPNECCHKIRISYLKVIPCALKKQYVLENFYLGCSLDDKRSILYSSRKLRMASKFKIVPIIMCFKLI